MKIIGITGGVGCGKSTVLNLIKENYNAYVIMADDVAKELMQPGNAAYNSVVDMFGRGILGDDGQIDRQVLAKIIFDNPNKRMVLNSIVHPMVKKTVVEQLTKLKISGEYDYVIVEAALLIEDHYGAFCDEIWYVYAPEPVRRARLKEARGYSDDKIDSMMKSQLTEQEFRNNCKTVINNGGDVKETLAQLEKLL